MTTTEKLFLESLMKSTNEIINQVLKDTPSERRPYAKLTEREPMRFGVSDVRSAASAYMFLKADKGGRQPPCIPCGPLYPRAVNGIDGYITQDGVCFLTGFKCPNGTIPFVSPAGSVVWNETDSKGDPVHVELKSNFNGGWDGSVHSGHVRLATDAGGACEVVAADTVVPAGDSWNVKPRPSPMADVLAWRDEALGYVSPIDADAVRREAGFNPPSGESADGIVIRDDSDYVLSGPTRGAEFVPFGQEADGKFVPADSITYGGATHRTGVFVKIPKCTHTVVLDGACAACLTKIA